MLALAGESPTIKNPTIIDEQEIVFNSNISTINEFQLSLIERYL